MTATNMDVKSDYHVKKCGWCELTWQECRDGDCRQCNVPMTLLLKAIWMRME